MERHAFIIIFFDLQIILSLLAESTSSVKTKCIQVDFGGGLEIYDTLSSDLAGLEIGLLGSVAACHFAHTMLVANKWFSL